MGGRPHPDVARARVLVRDALADLADGSRVLVAVSGGADSLALAAATAFVAPRRDLEAGAVVVDHGLQEGSDAVAWTAAARAKQLGLAPVEVARVEVGAAGGPEGAARAARYDALSGVAQRHDAVAVLLGHTLDDQAETVLMGLARGSGARSLAAMAPADGLWRRPFLALSRTQTRAVCEETGVEWWDDPHNDDTAYTRVRVRTQALPALEAALGPGVREALARTASLLRADADHLDELVERVEFEALDGDDRLDAETLAKLPRAIRTRVIRRHALRMGCPAADLTAAHVIEVERLVTDWHGQSHIELPGKVVARRVGVWIAFSR
ncbi:tRNA lysidine(34) synthetase TilS [Solicola gregarius]|uniref:tRNA(Ile)-lysidine synthase n=1 Tax=Solicola gregarius TaxID=2908642 RepID=A0AA46TLA0_9ACTN|nr:tRNA lysidine(34) synthetase TilS [Solicola gregarius]UYM07009.1 tRNA lysidine(34) synthetase TilS [Solicola gregarius]